MTKIKAWFGEPILLLICMIAQSQAGNFDARSDIVFVIDSSRSVGNESWIFIKRFCKEFSDYVSYDTDHVQFGAVTFGDDAHLTIQLGQYESRDGFKAAVDDMEYLRQSTNTASGIHMARTRLFNTTHDRPDISNIMLIITDGLPNDRNRTQAEADTARQEGIQVFVIGITSDIDYLFIRDLAGRIPGHYLIYSDYSMLVSKIESIVTSATASEIIVPGVLHEAEVVFLLDGSKSIGSHNWGYLLEFVLKFVDEVSYGRDRVRIGVLTFGDHAHLNVGLDDFPDEQGFTRAVERLEYLNNELKNVLEAMEMLKGPAFESARPGVQKFGIMLTDGGSPQDKELARFSADRLRQSDIQLFIMGVGEGNHAFFRDLCYTSDYHMFVPDYPLLPPYAAAVEEMMLGIVEPVEPLPLADIVFILDSSRSLGNDSWNKVLWIVKEFALHVNYGSDGVRLGVVSYADQATVPIQLDQYAESDYFNMAVDNIPYLDRNTNTADGIRAARTELFSTQYDRPEAKNIAILVTDGVPTYEVNETLPQSNQAREEGIDLFVVGVGHAFDEATLLQISGDRDYTLYVRSFDSPAIWESLEELLFRIGEILDTEMYTVTMPTTGTMQGPTTGTPNHVSTSSPAHPWTDSTATQSTTHPTWSTTSTAAHHEHGAGRYNPDSWEFCDYLDLMFILDVSSSVNADNFQHVKIFINHFLDSIRVTIEETQVGVITFSDTATLDISKGAYKDVDELKELIQALEPRGGVTNTSGALWLLHDHVFNGGCNRINAPNLGILITDGNANVDSHLTKQYANLIKDHGSCIVAIGVGSRLDVSELRTIACEPSIAYVKLLNDYSMLSDAAMEDDLRQNICVDSYDIEVESLVQTGVGLDLVFALGFAPDPEASHLMFDYVARNIDEYPEQLNNMHIGLATNTEFGPIADLQLEFIHDFPLVKKTIRQLPYRGSSEDDAALVRYIMQQMFMQQPGDRPEFDNTLILITNAQPSEMAENLRVELEEAKRQGIEVFVIVPRNTPLNLLDPMNCEPVSMDMIMAHDNLTGFGSLPYAEHEFFFKHPRDLNTLDSIIPAVVLGQVEPLWRCDFEEDCVDITQWDKDNFDWMRAKGPTSTRNTGPTAAYSGEWFFYIDASSPQKPGDTAVFILPVSVEKAGLYCLSFHYYLQGFLLGPIKVHVMEGEVDELRAPDWRIQGATMRAEWYQALITLHMKPGNTIMIEGIRGGSYKGDIAIDDLVVRNSPCSKEIP